MALTERDLAEWIMQDRGQKYVDLAGSDTIDTTKIIEIHKQDCIEKRFSDLVTEVECRAIRNWVAGAGYIDGKYVYLLYNTNNNTIN